MLELLGERLLLRLEVGDGEAGNLLARRGLGDLERWWIALGKGDHWVLPCVLLLDFSTGLSSITSLVKK